MYIKKIRIKNIRAIEDLCLSFASESDFRRGILILGDNGVGKTTLLRCIALGLSGDSTASALLSEIGVGEMRRRGSEGTPSIEIIVGSGTHPDSRMLTEIEEDSGGFNVKVTGSEEFPWDAVFCCGYGISRRPFGSESYSRYRLVDTVYTLFNYETSLWSPEVVLSRLQRSNIDFNDLISRLEQILELPNGSISLNESGLIFTGSWEGELALNALGDGYSATLGWLADMLSWALLKFGSEFEPSTLKGIVLIDMIEGDLHPRWQRTIIRNLSQNFPKIQFIMTTHAPMCAIGTSEMSDDECELIALHMNGDAVEATQNLSPPRNERIDEVLNSALFNVSETSGSNFRNDLERYISLLGEQVSSASNDEELQRLKSRIESRNRNFSIHSRIIDMLAITTDQQLKHEVANLSKEELDSSIEFLNALKEEL